MNLSLGLEIPRLGIVRFLVRPPLVWELQGRDRRFPVKILPCLYTARTRSVNKVNTSLGLETPRLGIVWFLVSLPLVWEHQGREQLLVKILPCLCTARARSERGTSSLSCKARLVWFPVIRLPYPCVERSSPAK